MNDSSSPTAVDHDPFTGTPLVAFSPITESQREVWLACVVDPDLNIGYNEGINLRLEGTLDVELMRASLQVLVDRHESMRMTVSPDGDWLCVMKKLEIEVPLVEAVDAAALEAAEVTQMSRSFDLEKGPLISFTLVRRHDGLHHLLFVAHHIICDGWSTAVLLTELGQLYSAGIEKRTIELPPPPRYTDYASVERAFLDSADGQAQERYWLEQLQDVPPVLDVPSERSRPAKRTFVAERIDRSLAPDLVVRLRKAAASQGASLVAMMLAGFSALLHRLTLSEDMVIGLSAAGQSMHQQGSLVGHCVNLLPLRLRPQADASFAQFLATVRTTVLDASDNQGITFGALIPKLNVVRDESHPPLVSVIFNIDVRDDHIGHTGLAVSYATMMRQAETFELYINVVDDGASLVIECSYNRDLFSHADIDRRLDEWTTLLESVCADPNRPLRALPIVDTAARQRVTTGWNNTGRDYPLITPLHQLIEAQVRKTPDAVALVFEQTRLSFAELDGQANQLAHTLVARGVKPDSIVAVCAQRGIEMVVAMLATLKAGGAYLPLDPAYPAERLGFMLEDSAAPVILVEIEGSAEAGADVRELLAQRADKVLDLKRDTAQWSSQPTQAPTVAVRPENLAYVIFTSGSTGKPKGALLEHRGIVNRLLWMQEEYRIGADDRVLQKTPYSFDVSVWEFFWPLLTGATLVMARPEGHKDPRYLAEVMQGERITVCHFVPSMLGVFLEDPDSAKCQGLRKVFCSGEALSYELTQRFFAKLPNTELHNLYGPTEASVDVTYWACPKTESRGIVPIGRPVANTQVYVLDANGEPLPVGVPGELMLGGVQLARGYLNRPELTAEKFITHPEFGRLYRTGDLSRWLPDGSIEYLGRLDFQVKLHGFRIELGEIEAELARHPAIVEAAAGVVTRGPGDQRLVAWFVARGDAPSASEMREHLRRTLPPHMVPNTFKQMDQLPLLSNGKMNRKALPNPFADRALAAAPDRTPPSTPTQIAVRDLWAQALGIDGMGLEDRFLDLGGHSLLAVQTVERIRVQFGVKLPVRTMMMESLGAVAAAIDAAAPSRPASASKGQATTTTAAPATTIAPAAGETATSATSDAKEGKGLVSRLKRLLGG